MRSMTTGLLQQQLQGLDGLLVPPAVLCTNSKRQRRPSVRLGEIGGDQPLPLVVEKAFKRRKPQRIQGNVAQLSVHSRDESDRAESLTGPDPVSFGFPLSHSLNEVPDAEHSESSFEFEDGEGQSDERLQDMLPSKEHSLGESLHAPRRERVSSVGPKYKLRKGKHGKRKRVAADRVPAGSIQRKNNATIHEISWGSTKPNSAHHILEDDPVVSFSRSMSGDVQIATKKKNFLSSDHAGITVPISDVKARDIEEADDESKHPDECSPKHPWGANKARLEIKEPIVDKQERSPRNLDGNLFSLNIPMPSDNEVLFPAASSKEAVPGAEVKRWLDALGLLRYANLFELHEVEKDVLPLLTLDDLREMGITAVGSRRKIYCAIQTLGQKELCQV
ncbi:hypothetical protein O6H91_22G029600 [Diphasiastrum complanatum]|uniref:Uncharacterized protein n=1 Tax=Diphasiastrum complanatum TaxID=34168 RepID=A0ACC2AE41_DIPCM|nr:hypothetical protein O6H91_Y148200 [Diphasiastrum complanatum]KAJ7515827.1 hypothetical protein O6H91_22G029600 [Diphasiastrum complanatum]